MSDRKSDIDHILSHVRHLFTGAPIVEREPEPPRPGTVIGETRSEAIDWVQDRLGPVTPRNVAEDTYQSLVTEGVIEVEIGRVALLEAQSEEELRVRATNAVQAQAGKRLGAMRRGRLMSRSTSPGARSAHHSHNRSRHNRTMKNGGDMTARKIDDDDQ